MKKGYYIAYSGTRCLGGAPTIKMARSLGRTVNYKFVKAAKPVRVRGGWGNRYRGFWEVDGKRLPRGGTGGAYLTKNTFLELDTGHVIRKVRGKPLKVRLEKIR